MKTFLWSTLTCILGFIVGFFGCSALFSSIRMNGGSIDGACDSMMGD